MKRTLSSIALVCCLASGGCGKKEARNPASQPDIQPVPPAATVAAAATNAVQAATTPEAVKPPEVVVEPTDEGFKRAITGVEKAREMGQFADAIEMLTKLQQTFPKHADEIAGLIAQMKEDRRESVDLEFAVKQLTKDDQAAADVAIQKLTEGGDVARIVLRKAIREREDAVVVEVLPVLVDLGDEKASEAVVQRFLKNPDSTIRPQLVEMLKKSVSPTSAVTLAPLYPWVKDDPQFKNRDIAGVLAVMLEKSCEGKSEKLDGVLGQGAYEQLKTYVQTAITSTNDAALARWGSNQATYFKVMVAGIKASYYEGGNFEKLLATKKDEYIWIDDRKFQFPDGRQDNLSIRWEGKIVIPAAGKYTFKIASDDGHRLWIDDKKLIDAWGGPSTQVAATDLDASLHDIKVEYTQNNGSGWIRMTWSGPGFEDKPLKQDSLRVVPWTAAKAPAEKK